MQGKQAARAEGEASHGGAPSVRLRVTIVSETQEGMENGGGAQLAAVDAGEMIKAVRRQARGVLTAAGQWPAQCTFALEAEEAEGPQANAPLRDSRVLLVRCEGVDRAHARTIFEEVLPGRCPGEDGHMPFAGARLGCTGMRLFATIRIEEEEEVGSRLLVRSVDPPGACAACPDDRLPELMEAMNEALENALLMMQPARRVGVASLERSENDDAALVATVHMIEPQEEDGADAIVLQDCPQIVVEFDDEDVALRFSSADAEADADAGAEAEDSNAMWISTAFSGGGTTTATTTDVAVAAAAAAAAGAGAGAPPDPNDPASRPRVSGYIFWDLCNCALRPETDAEQLDIVLTRLFQEHFPSVVVRAWARRAVLPQSTPDAFLPSTQQQRALSQSGWNLVSITGKKGEDDLRIIEWIREVADLASIRPPVIVVTGDRDFRGALDELRNLGVQLLLVHKAMVNRAFVARYDDRECWDSVLDLCAPSGSPSRPLGRARHGHAEEDKEEKQADRSSSVRGTRAQITHYTRYAMPPSARDLLRLDKSRTRISCAQHSARSGQALEHARRFIAHNLLGIDDTPALQTMRPKEFYALVNTALEAAAAHGPDEDTSLVEQTLDRWSVPHVVLLLRSRCLNQLQNRFPARCTVAPDIDAARWTVAYERATGEQDLTEEQLATAAHELLVAVNALYTSGFVGIWWFTREEFLALTTSETDQSALTHQFGVQLLCDLQSNTPARLRATGQVGVLRRDVQQSRWQFHAEALAAAETTTGAHPPVPPVDVCDIQAEADLYIAPGNRRPVPVCAFRDGSVPAARTALFSQWLPQRPITAEFPLQHQGFATLTLFNFESVRQACGALKVNVQLPKVRHQSIDQTGPGGECEVKQDKQDDQMLRLCAPPAKSWYTMVPQHATGMLIGTRGATIKRICDESGARIDIDTQNLTTVRGVPCHRAKLGGNEQAAKAAFNAIVDVVSSGADGLDRSQTDRGERDLTRGHGRGRGRGRAAYGHGHGRGRGRGRGRDGDADATGTGFQLRLLHTFAKFFTWIPSEAAPVVIGRGGAMQQQIKADTGVAINVNQSETRVIGGTNVVRVEFVEDLAASRRALARVVQALPSDMGGGRQQLSHAHATAATGATPVAPRQQQRDLPAYVRLAGKLEDVQLAMHALERTRDSVLVHTLRYRHIDDRDQRRIFNHCRAQLIQGASLAMAAGGGGDGEADEDADDEQNGGGDVPDDAIPTASADVGDLSGTEILSHAFAITECANREDSKQDGKDDDDETLSLLIAATGDLQEYATDAMQRLQRLSDPGFSFDADGTHGCRVCMDLSDAQASTLERFLKNKRASFRRQHNLALLVVERGTEQLQLKMLSEFAEANQTALMALQDAMCERIPVPLSVARVGLPATAVRRLLETHLPVVTAAMESTGIRAKDAGVTATFVFSRSPSLFCTVDTPVAHRETVVQLATDELHRFLATLAVRPLGVGSPPDAAASSGGASPPPPLTRSTASKLLPRLREIARQANAFLWFASNGTAPCLDAGASTAVAGAATAHGVGATELMGAAEVAAPPLRRRVSGRRSETMAVVARALETTQVRTADGHPVVLEVVEGELDTATCKAASGEAKIIPVDDPQLSLPFARQCASSRVRTLQPGEAVLASADSPVIFVKAPRWNGGVVQERGALLALGSACLDLACHAGCGSLSLPAVGRETMPVREIAKFLLRGILQRLQQLHEEESSACPVRRVRFMCATREELDAMVHAMDEQVQAAQGASLVNTAVVDYQWQWRIDKKIGEAQEASSLDTATWVEYDADQNDEIEAKHRRWLTDRSFDPAATPLVGDRGRVRNGFTYSIHFDRSDTRNHHQQNTDPRYRTSMRRIRRVQVRPSSSRPRRVAPPGAGHEAQQRQQCAAVQLAASSGAASTDPNPSAVHPGASGTAAAAATVAAAAAGGAGGGAGSGVDGYLFLIGAPAAVQQAANACDAHIASQLVVEEIAIPRGAADRDSCTAVRQALTAEVLRRGLELLPAVAQDPAALSIRALRGPSLSTTVEMLRLLADRLLREYEVRRDQPSSFWTIDDVFASASADHFRLEELDARGEEYAQVLSDGRWRETAPDGVTIVKIERVENARLWRDYAAARRRVRELPHNRDAGGANEIWGWHGSRSTPAQTICETGLDFRFSRDGMWGRGSYVAHRASYSHAYASRGPEPDQRQFFLVRVTLGKVADLADSPQTERQRLVKPPDGHDSVQGSTQGSTCWIVYDLAQSYPEYLVTYK